MSAKKVAVIGVGQTDCSEDRSDRSFPELVREAVTRALADAGVTSAEIEAVVYGQSPELFVGVNQPEKWCAEAAAAWGKPMFRIHTGGTVGASTGISAYYHVASGLFRLVLAVAGDKLSESPVQYGLSSVYDPILGRDFACGAPSAVALQARRYMARYGVTERQAALVAVKNRKNALKNPHAHLKIPDISVDMVLSSPMISSPLRLLDSCPVSDGVCAMVYAVEEEAALRCPRPAWVRGTSAVTEGVAYTYREWCEPIALKKAAQNAYHQAGISDPSRQIQVAEVYDAFTYQELIWSEALGFCGPGEGGKFVESGASSPGGSLPINMSGGVLSTNSIGAAAMMRQAEAALQVMGKAGERQVPGVKTALAHGWGGAIQFHTVMILSSERP